MASRDLTLNLKVDSKSGQASIKTVADALKKLGEAKGTSAASDDMKKLGANAAKAAEEYRKLIDASKADAERLRKIISVKKNAANADIRAIADASRADAERLRKSITAEKQLVAARNKARSDAIRLEKQRLAAINKTHLFSMRMQKQRTAEINAAYNEAARMNKQHDKTNTVLKNRVGIISRIKKSLFAMRSYWLAISAAVSIAAISVVKFFKAGFMAVERFRLSVASVAASITTFSDLSAGDVDRVYANAVKYSEKLALKMEIINARTIATGEQLRAMNETFIQQGVLLDINSKKQEDAFVSVANAISLITQGQNQEIQMRQEVRGLLSGDIRATNLLARMINAKLGGALKENIVLWKQQGTLLENLGNHLEGFKAGSADLASTWAALSTTFETIANRYLREAFKPIYKDIIDMSLIFSRNLLKQEDTTKDITTESNLLYKTWYSLKTTVKITLATIKSMKGPITAVLSLLSHSVEMIMVALIGIEVLTNKLNRHQRMMESTNKGLIEGAKSFWKKIFSSSDEAAKALEKSKKAFKEAGILAGDKFSDSFFDRWKVKYHEMMGTLQAPKKEGETETPTLVTPDSGLHEEGLKKAEDWFAEWERMEKENQINRLKIKHEGYQQSVSLLMLEKQALVDKYGEQDSIHENYNLKWGMLAKTESERKKELMDAELKKRAENQEKVLSYISTEKENKIRAIQQETQQLNNLTERWEEQYAIREAGQKKIDAIKDASAEKRRAHHEEVLSYISAEEENEIRALLATQELLLKKTDVLEEQNSIRERTSELISKVYEEEAIAIEEWVGKAKASIDSLKETSLAAAQSFSSGMANAFFEFTEGTKSAGEAFEDFARSFIGQVGRMITQMLILKAIQGIAGAFSGGEAVSNTGLGLGGGAGINYAVNMPSAKGNVFSQGHRMMEYAKGGIVNTPTIFPMANGAGLMGESGPEAILPLKRGSGGKLGVESNGEGSAEPTTVNVTYRIEAVDAASFAELTRRNPEALAGPIINEIQQGNSGLMQAIRVAGGR